MAKHPDMEQLGPPDLKVVGFQLWIHEREFPDSTDHDDSSWLRATAHCGAESAEVWVSGSILQVTDVVQWAKECEALLHGSAQTASLTPLEPELKAVVASIDSLGHLQLAVEITPNHLNQEHTFRFEIDQSYLPGIMKQCREIEKRYPVKSD
jgi:hypothetical protein